MFDHLAFDTAETSPSDKRDLLSQRTARVVLSNSKTLSGLADESARSERLFALGQAACHFGAMQLASEAADGGHGAERAHADGVDAADEDEVSAEWLLASGYAACFLGALSVVTSEGDLQVPDSSVAATVTLGSVATGRPRLSVALDVMLPDLDWVRAQDLLARAHRACPYTHVSSDAVDVVLRPPERVARP
jgi:organic hydroperoxide reductase OsmC/OhrA